MEKFFGQGAILVRYLISGGTSFATNIVVLYLLTDYLKVYYLYSAIVSFFVAFVVSFFMMKYWTFQDNSDQRTQKQLITYFTVAVFNLILNTLLVYYFVEKFYLWYVLAQVAASLIIAVWSFFIYKYLIFI